MPKVSVVVPVYNVEPYLHQCIDSILAQSLEDIEVIIVNDGSSDNSQAIISRYVDMDQRVKAITQENRGVASARNTGLDLATGDYVGFVDSDDWIDPVMYEQLWLAATNMKMDVVTCNYCNAVGTTVSGPVMRLPEKHVDMQEVGLSNFIKEYFLEHRFGCEVWTKIYRRKVLNAYGIRFENCSEVYAEDWLFHLYLFFYVNKIAFVDEPYYKHLCREGSITRSQKSNYMGRLMTMVRRFEEKALELGRLKEIDDVLPFVVYALTSQAMIDAITSQGGTLGKARKVLLEAEQCGFVPSAFLKMARYQDAKLSRRIFCWLVSKRFYQLASLYKYLQFVWTA